jgi:cytochrome c-type biogenesis protein CcmH/NrfG
MAGGGMTPEAMAQADEDNRLPPLPEELKHLEGEMEQGLTAKDMTPQDEADMARAFAEDDEEEPEIEHQEKPKTQTRRR